MSTNLADRYGKRSGSGRIVMISTAVAVGVAFIGWLLWAAWFDTAADAKSQLQGFSIVDDHQADVRVLVDIDEDAEEVSCRARALSEDKVVVGELRFGPTNGVDWIGCLSKGQSRPQ